VSSSSYARARRMARTVAASDSTARSASTLRMSGCSASVRPNAARWAVWCSALATAQRIPAADPMTQSSRVCPTISMMVRTPRPGSPTSRPHVPSNSTSDEALERLPSLSFRRCRRKGLRVPSGRTRGTAKQPMPSSVRARTRNRSHIGAEQNHLCPRRRYSSPGPPAPTGAAEVVLARTSEPPCFSVMAIPHVADPFSAARMSRPS
jgi:hypothetical protein